MNKTVFKMVMVFVSTTNILLLLVWYLIIRFIYISIYNLKMRTKLYSYESEFTISMECNLGHKI
jgi:hypothetical protein